MKTGYFRDGLPRMRLALPARDGEIETEFVVDTGFDGDLTLPDAVVRRLDAAVVRTQFIRLAGGVRHSTECYEIEWQDDESDEPRLLEVLVMEGNPLLGNGFLADHLLTIEIAENGEVLAEPM